MYAGGISPATTTPDYVIPLATTPYMSNVSMIEEQLPVTVSLCDSSFYRVSDNLIFSFATAQLDCPPRLRLHAR